MYLEGHQDPINTVCTGTQRWLTSEKPSLVFPGVLYSRGGHGEHMPLCLDIFSIFGLRIEPGAWQMLSRYLSTELNSHSLSCFTLRQALLRFPRWVLNSWCSSLSLLDSWGYRPVPLFCLVFWHGTYKSLKCYASYLFIAFLYHNRLHGFLLSYCLCWSWYLACSQCSIFGG